jgi:deoxyribodipyrimidine photolyase-related protein
MAQMYRVWDAMEAGHREAVLSGAGRLLARLEAGEVI